MKLKGLLISASVISLIGIGFMSQSVNADDKPDTIPPSRVQRQINGPCHNLTEEQQKLIKESYNALSQEEKDFYNKYHRQPKRDLSQEDLKKYHDIKDKIYSVLGEDFINSIKENRLKNQKSREEIRNNPMRDQENGMGRGKGKGQCGAVTNQ